MTAFPTLSTRSLWPALAEARDVALEAVAETLWPTRCVLCDAPGATLCPSCQQALPFIDGLTACPRCGAPHGAVQCTECNPVMLAGAGYDAFPLDEAVSAVLLTARTRRIVTTFKDQGERRLARDMAAILARFIPPRWLAGNCAVSYVPATGAARRRRGFDHAELLARELSWQTSCEFAPLLRPPHHRDQRKLSRRERALNAARSMDVLPGATVPERLVIVDDVCTTGATLYAAATALRTAGAARVFGATFARA